MYIPYLEETVNRGSRDTTNVGKKKPPADETGGLVGHPERKDRNDGTVE